jgi:hypothetical protein
VHSVPAVPVANDDAPTSFPMELASLTSGDQLVADTRDALSWSQPSNSAII